MKDNLLFVQKANEGTVPVIAIEKSVIDKVGKFLARNEREFHDNPSRCVIPQYDSVQSEPIRRASDSYGYDSAFGAILAVLTGWHFIKPLVHPIYYANSAGLRLIAQYGSPRKAYASLGN